MMRGSMGRIAEVANYAIFSTPIRGTQNVKLVSALLILALLGVAAARAETPVTAGAQGSASAQTAGAQAAPSQTVPPAVPAKGSSSAQTATATPEDHPVDWAPRQYVEMWNTGDISAEHQNTIFNNTVIMHSNAGERLLLTPAMVAQVVTAWRRSMPDLHFTITDTITQGNKVVLLTSFTGTYTKLLWPNTEDPAHFNPPRKIRDNDVLIFSVRNGKIEELWENYNEPRMRASMGSGWCTAEQRKPPAPSGKP
jgi:hypothetical protein